MIPNALIKYLYHFHVDRDYFECHEVLEEYWKEKTNQQKDSIWVAFILLAVANYHHRRNNYSGASRTLFKALSIFQKEKKELVKLGFDDKEFFEKVNLHLNILKLNQPYESYSLPIQLNKEQLSRCFTNDEISRMVWGKESDLSDEELINRHKLRDRSDVLIERNKAIGMRQNKRNN